MPSNAWTKLVRKIWFMSWLGITFIMQCVIGMMLCIAIGAPLDSGIYASGFSFIGAFILLKIKMSREKHEKSNLSR
jgi:hypothetical protein